MEPTEYFILILFIALGVFSIVAAALNLDWYFQTSGAMTFVKWLGRKGARIFYVLLGLGLIAYGDGTVLTPTLYQTIVKSNCFFSRLACTILTVISSPNR